MSKWWEDICNCCGMCCYARSYSREEGFAVDLSAPCKFLNEDTHRCRVYANRFHECGDCKKVNIFHALFNPLLPPSCAYVRKFRIHKYKESE